MSFLLRSLQYINLRLSI
uniref:Uncharacterized protein n=1 Tax=Rhizophora mucronata TaxID=61149 RepID=A0A2P2N3R1_RHIMU